MWGPGLFVLAGAGVIIARARRRDIPDAALSAEERQRLAALLQKEKTMSLLVVIAGLLLAGALGLLYFRGRAKGR
ncbi:hypothetical protein BANRA_00003 [Klebsiella pneumoniae]|nr:hypothetical protein BANRA_00003 [Klebsiella pneumoniae]